MEVLGNVLLFLIHGNLPWIGIYAPSIEAKMNRIGDMKFGKPMTELLASSPPEFSQYFSHCRTLGFEDKPDYDLLRNVFRSRMKEEGWRYDRAYDWLDGARPQGSLLPEEYKFEERFVSPPSSAHDCY